MRRIIITITGALVLLLASLGSTWGQGTFRVTFDGPPVMPPGSVGGAGYYQESGVGVSSDPSLVGFVRRWSGDPLFPDNGTAYLQPRGGTELFFTWLGASRRFDAISVDLALYSASNLAPVTVRFDASGYGRVFDLIATTEFTVAGIVDGQGRPVFQTFHFPPEFRGMYYLRVTPTAPLWSLDNLVLYIPEPSSWALLLAGGCLLWVRRRW